MSLVEEPENLRYVPFESFYRAQWQKVYRPLAVVLRNPDLAREATNQAMTRELLGRQLAAEPCQPGDR